MIVDGRFLALVGALLLAACVGPDAGSIVVPGSDAPQSTSAAVPMKTIEYRGGVVRFDVPAHWWERHFEDGGAEFWEEGRSWTFRLEVLTVHAEPSLYAGKDARDVLAMSASGDAPIRVLPDGDALQETIDLEEEGGTDLVIHHWQRCHLMPPDHHRTALFSFTSLASEAEDPAVVRELDRVRGEVERAVIASEIGETDG